MAQEVLKAREAEDSAFSPQSLTCESKSAREKDGSQLQAVESKCEP